MQQLSVRHDGKRLTASVHKTMVCGQFYAQYLQHFSGIRRRAQVILE
jgi:hypothetical protein